MKRLSPYDVVIPTSKMAVFTGATKRERKLLLDLFDRLAANPSMKTDWTVDDAEGRTHYRTITGRYLVTYWTDHAAREVRIAKLEKVG